jgi:hypothetical protein
MLEGMRRRAGLALAAWLLLLRAPHLAEACGIGAPAGPTGCEGTEHASNSWFLGAAAATTLTTLSFSGKRELDLSQYALAASVGYIGASRWSLRATFGMVLDGSLEGEGHTHDIGPGIVGGLSLSRHWAFGRWFVTGSAGAGFSQTTTKENGGVDERRKLTGIDVIRAGVLVGRTFGIVSPYVMARGFAGPVFWTLDAMRVTGTDTRRFQLGAGVSATTPSGVSLLLDVSVLGERGSSLGMAYRF